MTLANEAMCLTAPLRGPHVQKRASPRRGALGRESDEVISRLTRRPGEHIVASPSFAKFVGVWRRRDGDWRLQMNISNSDKPPASQSQ